MFMPHLVCLNPFPRGLVVYADRDSRVPREYAAYLKSAGNTRVGFLKRCSQRAGWRPRKDHDFYEVSAFAGVTTPQAVAMQTSKLGNGNFPLSDPVSWKEVGHARFEPVVNAAGVAKVKNDSAGMFRVIGAHFHALYGSRKVPFANVHDDQDDGGTKSNTRANFFHALSEVKEKALDFFAYAGHGTPNGLPSAGISTNGSHKENKWVGVRELIDEIKRLCRSDARVLLYACSTAAAGGFAEKLSRALPQMTVIGHRHPARGDVNPHKYRIVGGRSVAVKDELPADVRKLWTAKSLDKDYLYARFPFMTNEQIAEKLRSGAE